MTVTPGVPVVTGFSTDDPSPRAEIVVTPGGDNQRITIWRYSSRGREAVRGAQFALVSGPFLIVDYELPVYEAVQYTATGYDAAGIPSPESGQSDPVTLTPPEGCPWFADPLRPASSMRIQVVDWQTRVHARESSILWPELSDTAVVVAGTRRQPASTVRLRTTAADDLTRLTALSQAPRVLIRFDPSWAPWRDVYVHVGDLTEERANHKRSDGQRFWSAPLTPVRSPSPSLAGSLHTWGEVVATYATWADVIAAKATWLDLIRNPAPGV